MTLLIDNYDSFTYNLYQYLCELGEKTKVLRNDEIELDEIHRMKPQNIVLSPGPGHPDSSKICLEAIEHLHQKIPILGVCLGHQAIAHVFGGKVIRADQQVHGKLSDIRHVKRGVFRGIPSPFKATRYHSLVVDRETLPKCLEVTAHTGDGTIMALRHRKFNVVGLQFHPESFASEHGHELLRNFLKQTGSGR